VTDINELRFPPFKLVNEWCREESCSIPFEQNHYFVGRNKELDDVHQEFPRAVEDYHRIAIYGLGGVGKTQFAVEYFYRFRESYTNSFWVNATDRPSLISGLCAIGESVPLVSEKQTITGEQLARLTLRYLRECHESWLLVVDNLEDRDVLQNLPLKGTKVGHILITTRDPDLWRLPARAVEMQVLTESEAVQLLHQRDCSDPWNWDNYPEKHKVAKEIVHELGCLPLAIEQAAGYIRTTIGGLDDFMKHYKSNKKHFLSQKGRFDYLRTVATTWLMSIRTLEKETPLALELLALLAFLNPEEIFVEFLATCETGPLEWMKKLLAPSCLPMAVDALTRCSLIRVVPQSNIICIHRLVQDVVKDYVGSENLHQWRTRALELCDVNFPMPRRKQIVMHRRYRNQVMPCIKDPDLVDSELAAEMMSRMAWYLDCEGHYREAYELWNRALGMYQNLTNGKGREVFITMDRMGYTQMKLRKTEEAEKSFRTAFTSLRERAGERDGDTLASQRNLATALRLNGKREEGLALLEQTYKIQRSCMDKNNPRLHATVLRLAHAYVEENELERARELFQKVVDQTASGQANEYQTALSGLGWIYCRTPGCVDEGIACLEAARTLRAKTLGGNNPTTLKTTRSLGYAYALKGRMEEGIALLKSTEKKQNEILGEDHSETMKTLHLLKEVYEMNRKETKHCDRD
jgi:tetratricopeptide (TPR) repeat protein